MPPTSSRESETRGWRGLASSGVTRGAILLLHALLLAACGSAPVSAPGAGATPDAIRLDAIPFFAQDRRDDCGPASLAGVLAASGVATDPHALSPQVYLPGRHGSVPSELLAATRRAGRLPYLLDPDAGALLAELAAGRPVLVLQNLATDLFPVWHYAVLTGVDAGIGRFYLNTGKHQQRAVPARRFMRTWDRAQRWAMVALRPGEAPARANRERYLAAATAFDGIARPADAAAAWQAARDAWPDQALPHLALGNLAYQDGDLAAAARHYAAGLDAGTDPALANNLASVLGELGCPRRGEAVLERYAPATATPAAWQEALARTRRELAEHPGEDARHCLALPGTP